MIKIAGLQKMTLIDFPGKIAASVFLAGCNFKCGFCHNPDLVNLNPGNDLISEIEFFDFLKKRRDLIEGVCITGGEPLIYQNLPEFLNKIKKLGYLIKLDTNGFNYELLKRIIEQGLIDYIAMDIKASLDNYGKITKISADFSTVLKSLELIKDSGLDYEFRTTVLPKFHNSQEIEKIARLIFGAKKYYLQNFNNRRTLDPDYKNERPFTENELAELKKIAEKYVAYCEIR